MKPRQRGQECAIALGAHLRLRAGRPRGGSLREHRSRSCKARLQKLPDRPNVIGEPKRHRRRLPPSEASWTRQKLVGDVQPDGCDMVSSFFEKRLVRRVNHHCCMRSVKFCRAGEAEEQMRKGHRATRGVEALSPALLSLTAGRARFLIAEGAPLKRGRADIWEISLVHVLDEDEQ